MHFFEDDEDKKESNMRKKRIKMKHDKPSEVFELFPKFIYFSESNLLQSKKRDVVI